MTNWVRYKIIGPEAEDDGDGGWHTIWTIIKEESNKAAETVAVCYSQEMADLIEEALRK